MLSLVGLLGNPVAHSLSPRMHNAAFEALELDFKYVLMPVEEELLEETVGSLAENGFVGANVTVPYKAAVIPFLDEVDDFARRANSVNTIVIRDGKLSRLLYGRARGGRRGRGGGRAGADPGRRRSGSCSWNRPGRRRSDRAHVVAARRGLASRAR